MFVFLSAFAESAFAQGSREIRAINSTEMSPLNAAKWQQGGIFEGYTPAQEVKALRTQNSKKFKNADGSTTAQIGGNYHYKDQGGNWKDIDFSI
ncbi:MAG TPA: hypothetical protein PL084_11220, partial [Chitinophagales bacterium]|nr:hypothetical protein [Chitinophagales bacterium]